ncbi:MAG: fused MFS/spermidine synthase [Caulobacterales bacterium]
MTEIVFDGAMRRSVIVKSAAAPVFTLAIFLSAALVFSVQPMFSKMVLPIVGGSAGVWNVALVFFQAALLVGYIYAHLLQRAPFRVQIGVHLIVLVLAGLTLPIAVAAGFETPPESGQAGWLIGLFALSVGAPFVAISATAPLLQAWFARTGRSDAGDPYFLYAASNVGSLIALLGYPLLLEPLLGAHAQADIWFGGFVALGALIACCGLLTLGSQAHADDNASASSAASAVSAFRATWGQRFSWVLYAFAPSMLLVAASTHITTDVASAPLLWVAPLALYLLAFIVAFSRKALLPARTVQLFHLAMVVSALILSWIYVPWTSLLIVTLMALFFGCWVCLQELYNRRPEAAGLTEFYVWMSVGGVLGGAFAALAAPVIFDVVMEYPLALALTLLLRPWGAPTSRPLLWIAGTLFVVAAALTGWSLYVDGKPMAALIYPAMAMAMAAMVMVQRNPLALAAGGLVVALLGMGVTQAGVIQMSRSFYGMVSVSDDTEAGYRMMSHGTTVHGVQSTDPMLVHTPGAYYGPKGPIGQAFRVLNASHDVRRVDAIGLGVGAVSCYAKPGQAWTFYEIDRDVVHLARDSGLFTYVSHCAPDARMVLGDGRLMLAREPQGVVDILLVDAFSSDSVPAHLLTQEAFALYLSHLSETGVALIHISNRNLALGDVVARAATAAGGLVIERKFVNADSSSMRWQNLSTELMAVAKSEDALAPIMATGDWAWSSASDRRVWTDDYTNIMEPLLTRMRESKR